VSYYALDQILKHYTAKQLTDNLTNGKSTPNMALKLAH